LTISVVSKNFWDRLLKFGENRIFRPKIKKINPSFLQINNFVYLCEKYTDESFYL